MKRLNTSIFATGLLGLILASSAIAQQSQQNFPQQRTSTKSCEEVNWNSNMLQQHPRLIEACQEVIQSNGESWARFHAQFKEVKRDGKVVFDVTDRRNRSVEEITLTPASGQMAYIDGRATAFRNLPRSQVVNLYVPEGEYGFATRPGASREQIARAEPRPSRVREQTTAQRDSRPAVLPATASYMPWFALVGFLSLFAGLTLMIRRWS